MRERILLRHIALQGIEAIDDDSMERSDYIEWIEEMILDVALMMSNGQLDSFEDARRIVKDGA